MIEDFLHLPPLSTTPVVHLELRISPRIFEKIRNDPNGILRGLGETDTWKNRKSKISWHCSFKSLLEEKQHSLKSRWAVPSFWPEVGMLGWEGGEGPQPTCFWHIYQDLGDLNGSNEPLWGPIRQFISRNQEHVYRRPPFFATIAAFLPSPCGR